jgi:hypothetical protein
LIERKEKKILKILTKKKTIKDTRKKNKKILKNKYNFLR